MESSISKKDIQRWIINKRRETENEGWRKDANKDKYAAKSTLLHSLENFLWNHPHSKNNGVDFKFLTVDEYLKYLKLVENKSRDPINGKELFLLKCAETFKTEAEYYEQLYYDLNKDLYVLRNRLGLNTNCSHCEEFSHCNKWFTSTPCPNYKKKETVELDKELFEEVLHELSIASGLYACDNEKMEEKFQLNYNDLINKLKKAKKDNDS